MLGLDRFNIDLRRLLRHWKNETKLLVCYAVARLGFHSTVRRGPRILEKGVLNGP